MESLLTIFYFLLGCLFIYQWKFFQLELISRWWLISLFALKIIVAIGITYIYTYYYTQRDDADIYNFFDDGAVMAQAFFDAPKDFFQMLIGFGADDPYFYEAYYDKMNFWDRAENTNLLSDTHLMIRLNAVIHLFSFGNIMVHNVFFNFFSLIGITAIFKAIKMYFHQLEKVMFLILALTPSFLFWGSGLLKESIIIFALGFLLLHLFNFQKNTWIKNSLIIIGSFSLILFSKFFIAVTLVPAIIGYVFHRYFKWNLFTSYSLSLLIIFAISLGMYFSNFYPNPIDVIINKQHDFMAYLEHSPAKSEIEQPFHENLWDLITYTPQALVNVFVRPFIWESYSIFTLFSALENMLFFIVLVTFFVLLKKSNVTTFFYFAISFSFTSAIIIGLITPIMGAIVRYKIFSIVFLLLALLSLINKSRIPFQKSFLFYSKA